MIAHSGSCGPRTMLSRVGGRLRRPPKSERRSWKSCGGKPIGPCSSSYPSARPHPGVGGCRVLQTERTALKIMLQLTPRIIFVWAMPPPAPAILGCSGGGDAFSDVMRVNRERQEALPDQALPMLEQQHNRSEVDREREDEYRGGQKLQWFENTTASSKACAFRPVA